MSKYPNPHEMASLGYVFPGMKGWIEPERINQIAADAALITTPNTAVPGIFTTYIDPNVVTILSAVQGARQVFSEVTKGTWKDRYMQFEVDEVVGRRLCQQRRCGREHHLADP